MQWPLVCSYLYRQRLYVVLGWEPPPSLPGTVRCFLPLIPAGLLLQGALQLQGGRERILQQRGDTLGVFPEASVGAHGGQQRAMV